MKVFECGTRVITKLAKVEATISAIEIKFANVTYQLKYFADNEFETIWVNEAEFEVESEKRQLIGFKKS